MITQNELKSITLSPTKKDFYQIWNELLENAKKISDIWDPTSTNESDPGIVLLKVLAAAADVTNYNIDTAALEGRMPSVAQMESMRALCEMLGYNIKYYQSAETSITLAYLGDTSSEEERLPITGNGLEVPMFTTITNADKDINYVTVESKILSNEVPTVSIDCIEGQVVQCESDSDNVINMSQLDDDFKYYLPETQIAENGIFVYNLNDGIQLRDRWQQVANLNTQPNGTLCYKFGYDSTECRPYLQFPEDIAQLIEDGLKIYYIRTSGAGGNIAANTLTTFEIPSEDAWESYSATDKFTVTNPDAATNGANIETITQAYNNFKKTIGTFDTLVTCRDYLNKIYSLTTTKNTPVVSNINVTDVRDDINKAIVLCSFNNYGICYKEKSLTDLDNKKLIENFDLMLYPFKTYSNLNTAADYNASFNYTTENMNLIEAGINDNKTLAHNIRYPNSDEIVSIRNYYKLNARITTIAKVNIAEEKVILSNIKKALFSAFNMRNLDFGEEIPFDSILEVIEGADSRIKNVSLDEPTIYTKFLTADSQQRDYDLSDNLGKLVYNKLALRNILAGRVELFNYDTAFKTNLTEANYNSDDNYASIYSKIKKLSSTFTVSKPKSDTERIKLKANEVIKFRAPNFKTTVTYPAYVNYYLHLNDSSEIQGYHPASFITIEALMNKDDNWMNFINYLAACGTDYLNRVVETISEEVSSTNFNSLKIRYKKLFIKDSDECYKTAEDEYQAGTAYYKLNLNETTFAIWNNWIKSLSIDGGIAPYNGIYRNLGFDLTRTPGYLIDEDTNKYQLCTVWHASADPFTNYFVQDVTGNNYGLGEDGIFSGIPANSEYKLAEGEYLLINYTESTATADTTTSSNDTKVVKNVCYGSDTIIRPNFNLNDSKKANINGKSFSKTTGFNFEGDDFSQNAIPGMFSLGTDEQIEMREQVQVTLDNDLVYLYWILNTTDNKIDNNTTSCEYNPASQVIKYTLQDGEYLFYTDKNKLDLAYYGSGTEIELHNCSLIPQNTTMLSVEDILAKGISAVPWKTFHFDKSNTDNAKYLCLNEYQYINLVEGNELKTWPIEKDTLDNSWQSCINTPISYIQNGTEQEIPQMNIPGVSWSVRSILEFNMGPAKAQTLNINDFIDVILDDGEDTLVQLRSSADDNLLSLKTNYACIANTGIINCAELDLQEAVTLKLFKDIGILVSNTETENSATNLAADIDHNLNNIWTKVSFATLPEDADKISLNTIIPTNDYGLLMLYYVGADNKTDNVYLTATKENNLSIFNNYGGVPTGNIADMQWWSDNYKKSAGETVNYYLKPGINIVKIANSDTVCIHADTNKKDIVIYGELDLIKTDAESQGLNIDILDYQDIGVESASVRLLKELAAADNDPNYKFYYNCPLDNNTALELNKVSNTEYDKLSSAHSWYDYNNLNNNFVISKIDTDHLDSGIRIAKSSKL